MRHRLLFVIAIAAVVGGMGRCALGQENAAGPSLLAPPANGNVLAPPVSPEQVFSGGPAELPTGDAWVEVGPAGNFEKPSRPSWCAKRMYVDMMAGPIEGSDLNTGSVRQDRVGVRAGLGLGSDINSYWGIEKHFGYSDLQIADRNHGDRRAATAMFGELRAMFYPLGDKPFRPYLTAGIGGADFRFRDANDEHLRRGAVLIPYGAGVKYLISERVALRAEILDDFTFSSSHLSAMHNVSAVGGVEIRFCKPKLGTTTFRWLWQ